MKITQITYTGFGGLASVVFSLIAADRQNEHYQWAIGFIGDVPLDESYPPRCVGQGVEFAEFRSISGRPYRAWIDLYRWLAKTKPDAVICHSINSILPSRWYAWWYGAKLISVEHTSNNIKSRNEWFFSRLSMVLSDRVVVLTDEYRNELSLAHGWLYRANKVTVIPNGIDTDIFYPNGEPDIASGRTIKLGMAARFSVSKRQDLLVAVVERLATLRRDLSIEIVFAGDGEEFSRVQQLAAASSVASRIRFDGLVSEGEIASWLRELDIYVHATEGETLSTSVLQAMATGLPIVASEIPGVSNLLCSDGVEYGVCVENNVEAFAHVVIALVDDKQRALELGTRARHRVLNQYINQTMLMNYLEVMKG